VSERRRTGAAIARLVAVEGGARALSFAFYIAAARILAPAAFGTVRYTIVVSSLAFFAMQVIVTGTLREIGAHRGSPAQTSPLVWTSLALCAAGFALTAPLCVALDRSGALGTADLAGLLAVLASRTVFEVYYAAARGVGETWRAGVAYAGGSALQLALLIAVWALAGVSAQTALLLYAASSIVAVVICEAVRPLLFAARPALHRDVAIALLRTGPALALAQAGYLVWSTADQVWVENALGSVQVGLYAAARNLVQLYVIVPTAVCGVVLPRMARAVRERRPARAARLLRLGTGLAFGVTAAMALAVFAVREPLITATYGSAYADAAQPMAWLSVAMVAYAAQVVLTSGAIASDRPWVMTFAIGAAALAEVGWLVASSRDDLLTAAQALAAGAVAGLLVAGAWALAGGPRLAGPRERAAEVG
jgi:O-antigen/teichoic acid export membrane protein